MSHTFIKENDLKKIIDLFFILIIWIFCILLTNPNGNFPLDDDWSFGIAVKRFYETRDFRPTDWTSMPLISNVIWGFLFCLPKGFSFDILRLSTLTSSLIGLWSIYIFSLICNVPRQLALLISLTTAACPIFFINSFNFFTDSLANTLMLISCIFFALDLLYQKKTYLILGFSFVLASILSRHVAIAIPLAYAIATLFRDKNSKKNLIRSFGPFFICLIILFSFNKWLEITGRMPALYKIRDVALAYRVKHFNFEHLIDLIKNSYIALMYLGLFLLPILIYSSRFKLNFYTLKSKIGILLILLIFLIEIQLIPIMPLSSNQLHLSGLGALTMEDGHTLHTLPTFFWKIITFLSIIGSAMIIYSTKKTFFEFFYSYTNKKNSPELTVKIFLFFSIFISIFPIVIIGFFEKYLLPSFLLMIIFVNCSSNNEKKVNSPTKLIICLILILFYLTFSILSTRDYLTWNRLRWSAINYLTTSLKVPISKIDGGFEFNGLYFYDSKYTPIQELKWWRKEKGLYKISFGEESSNDYTVIRRYKFVQWHSTESDLISIKVLSN